MNSEICSSSMWSLHDFHNTELFLTQNLLNQGFMVVKLKSLLLKIPGIHHDVVNRNDHGYFPFVVMTIRSLSHSWPFTGLVTRVTRRVTLVEQELSSHPVCNVVRVTRSLVLCVILCRLLFFFYWVLCCLFFNLQILIIPLVSYAEIVTGIRRRNLERKDT